MTKLKSDSSEAKSTISTVTSMSSRKKTSLRVDKFSRALRSILLQRNMNVRDLSLAMGHPKSASYLANIVRGEAKPREGTITKIEEALNLKPGTLGKHFTVPLPAEPQVEPTPEATSKEHTMSDEQNNDNEPDTAQVMSALDKELNNLLIGIMGRRPEPRREGVSVSANRHDPSQLSISVNFRAPVTRKQANRIIKALSKAGIIEYRKIPKGESQT